METPVKKRRSLAYWLGVGLILFAPICPTLALLVPWLGLSTAKATLVIGLLLGPLPEVCTFLGVLLAGREILDLVHGRMKRLLRALGLIGPVGPVRHYCGVSLILLGLLWGLVLDYLFLIAGIPQEKQSRLYLLVSGNGLVLVGILLAGQPFWGKLKRLFLWTPEEPPPPPGGENAAAVPSQADPATPTEEPDSSPGVSS